MRQYEVTSSYLTQYNIKYQYYFHDKLKSASGEDCYFGANVIIEKKYKKFSKYIVAYIISPYLIFFLSKFANDSC